MTRSRNGGSNLSSEDVTAQAPRLMSTRQRKMMIMSRRSSNPVLNRSDSRASEDDRKSAIMLSQSKTSQAKKQEDSRLAGGYSSSSVSGSLFANIDDRASVGVSNMHKTETLNDGGDVNILSPHPNLSVMKTATPSSLFGEIMKRAHAENITDRKEREGNFASSQLSSCVPFTEINGVIDFDDEYNRPKRKGSLFDGDADKSSGSIPKRRNVFKKYSKVSEHDVAKFSSQENNMITSDNLIVAPHNVSQAIFSSPQKNGLLSSSTSHKAKSGVVWDPTTSISQNLSNCSPSKTPDKRHMTPPRKRNIKRHPKTPDIPKPSFTPSRFVNSPGGFALMRIIDSCMSPHLSNVRKIMTAEDGQESKSSTGSVHTVLDDWNETWINCSDHRSDKKILDVGMIDWSIKSSIRIECSPSDCVPGQPFLKYIDDYAKSFSAYHSESRTDELAFELFSNPEKIPCMESNSKEQEDLVCARWKAACMYWQYPMVHDYLRNYTTNSSNTSEEIRHTNLMQTNSSSSSTSTFNQLRRKNSSLAQGVRSQISSHLFLKQNDDIEGSLHSHPSITKSRSVGHNNDRGANYFDAKISMEKRRKDWQQCFVSIYKKWIARIHEANESETLLNLSREYFYCLSDEYTLLFRATRKTIDEKVIHSPLIILSFSTKETRSTIKSMGISLKFWDSSFDSSGAYKAIDEQMIIDWSAEKVQPEIDEHSDYLRKELEDLRKSTNENLSVGVSILTTTMTKKDEMLDRSNTILPLLMTEHDDCMAFCELMLNNYGDLSSSKFFDRSHQISDVPLLLSRYLGPVPFMNLCALYSNQKQNDPAHIVDKRSDSISSINLIGPILPCSLNDLILASTSHFQLHKKKEKKSITNPKSDGSFDASIESIGSHYYVMHTQVCQGDDDNVLDFKKNLSYPIGSKDSLHLNSLDTFDSTESKLVYQPKRSSVISLVIWDINRPSTLTTKEDHYMEHQQNCL